MAEFAPAELAAVLGWTTETVKELMGDAAKAADRMLACDPARLGLPSSRLETMRATGSPSGHLLVDYRVVR